MRRMRRVVGREHENAVFDRPAQFGAVFIVAERRRHLVISVIGSEIVA
jgi:hypothetical protein